MRNAEHRLLEVNTVPEKQVVAGSIPVSSSKEQPLTCESIPADGLAGEGLSCSCGELLRSQIVS